MNALPYVILYLLPAAISAPLAIYGWRQRHHVAARPFSLLMAAIVFWSICHALSIAGTTLAETLFWAQIQYGGIVLVPPMWLLFAIAYAGRWSYATNRVRLMLLIPSALAYAAVLTNGWHSLWWSSVALDLSRPFLSLNVERGTLFWVHAVYTYACILTGLILLIQTSFVAPAIYRRQALLVVSGALFPLLGNVAHLLGLETYYVDDPTPFLFAASGAVMFYAMFRYRLLDLAPIAQREIFESMPDGVVVLDRRGVVVAVNDPAPGLLALTAREWTGRKLLDYVAASPLAAHLRQMLAPPAPPATRRVTYTTPDGLRAVEIRLRPLFTSAGTHAGALLVLHDITDQVRVQQALDQRVAELTLLNQIARAANAAAQTDELLQLIGAEVARAASGDRVMIGLLQPNGTLRLSGGQPQGDAAAPEGEINVADPGAIEILLRGGRLRELNIDAAPLAGTPVAAMLCDLGLRTVLVEPLGSQAEPLGLLLVGHADAHSFSADELRLFETVGNLVSEALIRMRLYEEARQASNLKSSFLATVSHELRTPLTSIIGYTDMLQGGLFGPTPDQLKEPLASIRYSGETLLRLINDLLNFSKIEAGHFTVDVYAVDLRSVIESVIGVMRPQIYARGLELHLDLAPDMPLVQAHTAHMEQVLTNLLANAIKFTDAGSITVRTRLRGATVRMSVQDTGIGIAPEDQGQLFQVFRQVENAHTRRFGGTGLGLAISKRLVELMDGTLSLESEPGVGSIFHCDLRVASAERLRELALADEQR